MSDYGTSSLFRVVERLGLKEEMKEEKMVEKGVCKK
jgi:hypothetical protein